MSSFCVGIHEGIDNWPERVQEPLLGAVNTVVLIASSVFVVLAWVGLKMPSGGPSRSMSLVTAARSLSW
ncbi:MAG: hypothetical protein R3F31_06185 [Verrucomicrobiales bacterium]